MAVGALVTSGWLMATGVSSRRRLAALMAEPVRRSRARTGVLGAAALVALVAVLGPAPVVVAVAAGGAVARAATRARARQAEDAARAAVVELLRAIAGELRSGAPPPVAFVVAADAAPPAMRAAIGPAARAAARGDPLELAAALRAVAASSRSLVGLARVAACWRVAATSGAALAPAVDRVADALHDEIEFATSLLAALAAPRATARLLAVLPVVGLALGGAIGARPLSFLLGSPAGLCCLAVAVGFEAGGVGWARRIARNAALIG
jgi:tight adherence protein B